MLAVDIHDAAVHHRGCGFHESLAMDRDNLFLPVAKVCPLCAAMEQQERAREAEDAKALERLRNKPSAPLPSDGRHITTRLLSAEEAERRRAAAAAAPEAQEPAVAAAVS